MKKLVASFVLALLLFVPLALWLSDIKPPWAGTRFGPPLPPIVQIQTMSDLATTKIAIADFLEGQDEHYEGKWVLYGDATLGVDLSKASYWKTDDATRTATLMLPEPHIISWKHDPDRLEEIYVRGKGWLWMVSTGTRQRLRDEAAKQADRKIKRLAEDDGYKTVAKHQAEKVLRALFDGLGWKIAFQWPGANGTMGEPKRETAKSP
jgi:hypothetical protein